MNKTIVILANSVKHGKHCVAGKCINTKQWIRPVANDLGKELTKEEASYVNKYGKYVVKPKQKIEMNLVKQVSLVNQPENYLIDNNSKWEQKFKIEDFELEQYLDYPSTLWGTSSNVPYNEVINNEILIEQSLYLVKVDNLQLYVNSSNKRRAKFNYNNIQYDLPVTDPQFDKIVLNNQELSGILCLSLGECFNNNCYKIVATIF